MSQFTTPLILQMLPDDRWGVHEQFEYHIGEFPGDDKIIVPTGFVTDLASTPRLLWWLVPPFGKYGKATVLHDYLYSQRKRSQKKCDEIFIEAMKVLGVNVVKRRAMFYAVRLFGRLSY